MIRIEYNVITGASYSSDMTPMSRKEKRNPKVELKACAQLIRAAKQASFAMNQLQGALYQYGNLQKNQ